MLIDNLANGLEYVVKNDPLSQMVAIQCWISVGSLHEQPQERGMAHLMEHMLFKGTPTRAVGEISHAVEAAGGEINAYTSFDCTVYYLTLAAEHLQLGIELLADAVFHASLDEAELEREKLVVLEEIKRTADSPGAKLGQAIFRHLFKGTEAARPIIGDETSVSSFTRDDLQHFHKRWYHPENMKVVVAGAVDEVVVSQHIARSFGESGFQPFHKVVLPKAEPLTELSVEVIRGDYQQPRLALSFNGPHLGHEDMVAMDVVGFILTGGDSSRWVRRLRDDEGLVIGIGCSSYTPSFGGGFEISAYPVLGAIETAIQAIGREVELLLGEPLAPEELAKARASLRIDRLCQEETVSGQARSLGHSLFTQHKLHYDDVYQVLLERITAAEISRAVKRWLRPTHAVVVALVPNDCSLTADELRAAFVAGTSLGRALRVEAGESAPEKKLAPQALHSVAKPQELVIKPGLNLVVREVPTTQLFSLVAVSEGGLRDESELEIGAYNGMAEMLANATTKLGYDELVDRVEMLGASLYGFSGKDSYGLRMQCHAEHAVEMLQLFADCLLEPVFPEAQWEITQRDTLQTIHAEADAPANIALRLFQESLFGGHPYRFPFYGTKETVSSFTASSLREFFLSRRDSRPWTLAAVGPFSIEWLQEHLAKAFRTFQPKSQRPLLLPGIKAEIPVQRQLSQAKDREQVHIVIGARGLNWQDPDRAALDVLSAVLGGSSGRLFLRLRDQESLAYSVSPLTTYGIDPGIVATYIACAPEKRNQAIAALRRELDAVIREEVSVEELSRAKEYVIGNHEADLQRGEAQALTMALMATYGLGYADFLRYPASVRQVNAAAVRKVARRVFEPAAMIEVAVGPAILAEASS